CFYINLPIGAFAVLIIFFLVKIPSPEKAASTSGEKIKQLDLLVNVFFFPAVVCLLLSLQWGGSKYEWNNGRIIALLVLFGPLIMVWFWTQHHAKGNVTLPLRILRQRSVAAGFFFAICLSSAMMIWGYFLPLYFQAIFGSSAVHSGIQGLPLVLSLVLGAIMAGGLVTAIGYYTPFMILSSCVMATGAGLCTTFGVHTSAPHWIGYQIVVGFGIGLGMQQSSMAAQRVLDKEDVATGVSLMFFAQGLGGAVSLSIAQNVLSRQLITNLSGFPDFDPRMIIDIGATALRSEFSPENLPRLLVVYSEAIIRGFYIAL
ncbi:MAG: hypothetical protein Q9224_007773, partial [Gallowayella concinna]